MACFTPLPAFKGELNPKTFKMKMIVLPRTEENLSLYSLRIPCNKCSGCRLEYSRQWAIRCMHESQMHDKSAFITLTYNDEFLPANASLDYSDWTNFMKRLRFRLAPLKIRFYMGPEYGELNGRPHYHALIFGYDFPDKLLFKKSNELPLYTSALLSDLWSCPETKRSMGFCSVGSVTFESAAYVARYMMKKVKGEDPTGRYWTDPDDQGVITPIAPEKARMSRMPGIAKDWFDTFYESDVKDSDYVILNNKKVRPPKYYDTLLERIDPVALEAIKEQRTLDSAVYADHNTEERLAIRKIVHESKLKDLIRPLSSGDVTYDF